MSLYAVPLFVWAVSSSQEFLCACSFWLDLGVWLERDMDFGLTMIMNNRQYVLPGMFQQNGEHWYVIHYGSRMSINWKRITRPSQPNGGQDCMQHLPTTVSQPQPKEHACSISSIVVLWKVCLKVFQCVWLSATPVPDLLFPDWSIVKILASDWSIDTILASEWSIVAILASDWSILKILASVWSILQHWPQISQ